jgi:GTP cyclohydrolase I
MDSLLAEKMLSFPTNLSAEAELVRCALVENGLETPMISNGLSRDQKYQRIAAALGGAFKDNPATRLEFMS